MLAKNLPLWAMLTVAKRMWPTIGIDTQASTQPSFGSFYGRITDSDIHLGKAVFAAVLCFELRKATFLALLIPTEEIAF